MENWTLGIALIALVIAIAAFYRTGGMRSLRQQVERVGARTEDAAKFTRETTADALERIEKLIRGKQEAASEAKKVASETKKVPSEAEKVFAEAEKVLAGAGNPSPEIKKDPPKVGSE